MAPKLGRNLIQCSSLGRPSGVVPKEPSGRFADRPGTAEMGDQLFDHQAPATRVANEIGQRQRSRPHDPATDEVPGDPMNLEERYHRTTMSRRLKGGSP